MSDGAEKNPFNVPGRYYVTDDCLACEACQDAAPNHFRYDDHAQSYIFKQPTTPEEEEQCRIALSWCPLEAIRDNGET